MLILIWIRHAELLDGGGGWWVVWLAMRLWLAQSGFFDILMRRTLQEVTRGVSGRGKIGTSHWAYRIATQIKFPREELLCFYTRCFI